MVAKESTPLFAVHVLNLVTGLYPGKELLVYLGCGGPESVTRPVGVTSRHEHADL